MEEEIFSCGWGEGRVELHDYNLFWFCLNILEDVRLCETILGKRQITSINGKKERCIIARNFEYFLSRWIPLVTVSMQNANVQERKSWRRGQMRKIKKRTMQKKEKTTACTVLIWGGAWNWSTTKSGTAEIEIKRGDAILCGYCIAHFLPAFAVESGSSVPLDCQRIMWLHTENEGMYFGMPQKAWFMIRRVIWSNASTTPSPVFELVLNNDSIPTEEVKKKW